MTILEYKIYVKNKENTEKMLSYSVTNNMKILLIIQFDCEKHHIIRKYYRLIFLLKKKNKSKSVIFIGFDENKETDKLKLLDISNIEDYINYNISEYYNSECEDDECEDNSTANYIDYKYDAATVNIDKTDANNITSCDTTNIFESNIFRNANIDCKLYNDEKYSSVIVGGTFDRIHEGHFLLLSTAFLLVKEKLTIGLTTEVLHMKKAYKEIIQTYKERKEIVIFFCKIFGIKKAVISPLSDFIGLTDKENFDCVVVSEETYKVSLILNEIRRRKNLALMKIVVTPMISTKTYRISSSELRRKELSNIF
ncbi:putative cytidyltransferase [Hamiltosporidium tvaerminnensis]|uniref:Putative cytidyltransferase n=1 Tax=Hamiltosporidium tvaerminnensis TaxID=1176355 RepID=A0A4Q9LWB2_9MICR|nr:putative cytidyltransferase [Hamiltosporidium tvaerminnensis]